MVHDIFSVEEATSICSMTICPQRQVDKRVWVGAKNGEFMGKSAYHLLKEGIDMSNGGSSKVLSSARL